MTMADRNISQLNEEKHSTTEHTDQQCDVPSSDESAQPGSHPKNEKNLDLNNSPLHRTPLSTRDSGYGTDFSPVTVVTPSTNKPQAQQFVFDSVNQWHVQGQLNRKTWSYQDSTSTQVATSISNIHAQDSVVTQRASSFCSIYAQGNALSNVAITTCNIHAQGNELSHVVTTSCNAHAQGNELSHVVTTSCNAHAQGNALSQVVTSCNIQAHGNALSQVPTTTCNIHAQDNAQVPTTTCNIHAQDNAQVPTITCNIHAQGDALTQVPTTTCNIHAQGDALSQVPTTTCNIHAQDNAQVPTTTCNIHAQGDAVSQVPTTTCNIHAHGNALSQVPTTTCNIHAQDNAQVPTPTCNIHAQDNAQVPTTTCNIHAHGNALTQLAKPTSNINSQGDANKNQKESTSTRLPIVVRLSSPSEVFHRDFNISSRSLSEPSAPNQIQFGYEINYEEEDDIRRLTSSKSHRQSPPSSPLLRNDFQLSQIICNLPLHDTSFDNEDDDESEFTNRSGNSKNMNITYDTNVPTRRRRISISTRSRRYCSEDDDESMLGACGGCDQSRNTSAFEDDQRRGQRSRSLSEYMYGEDIAEDSRRRITHSEVNESYNRCIDFDSLTDPESPLSCSQGFQPGYFDSDSKDNDSVFYFDHDSFEDEKDTRVPQAHPATSFSVTFAGEVSNCSSHARQRRAGVTGSLPVTSGCLSTRFNNAGGVTVSTQTPHMASVMIQQLMVSSLPLPNVARGTAASRLRCLSESGVPLPPRSAPLPDIIMSAGRDRSLSVPNLQALSLRQRAAREVGQELRRLSDEFNCRRNLGLVNVDGIDVSIGRNASACVELRTDITSLRTFPKVLRSHLKPPMKSSNANGSSSSLTISPYCLSSECSLPAR